MKIQDSKSSNLTLSTSLFEELSEVELEAVSGGALVDINRVDVDVNNNEVVKDVDVAVPVVVLSKKSGNVMQA